MFTIIFSTILVVVIVEGMSVPVQPLYTYGKPLANQQLIQPTEDNEQADNTGQYSYKYYVIDESTGDFKTQEETRNGDEVSGSYTIADPNGDLRTVTYTAGKGKGFNAVVDIKPGGSPMFGSKKDNNSTPASGYFMEIINPQTPAADSASANSNQYAVTHVRAEYQQPEYQQPIQQQYQQQEYQRPRQFSVDNFRQYQQQQQQQPQQQQRSVEQYKPHAFPVGPFKPRPFSLEQQPQESSQFGNYRRQEENKRTHRTVKDDQFRSKLFKTTQPQNEAGYKIKEEVNEEVDKVIDEIPKSPELHVLMNHPFFKNSADLKIDDQITQVARQLAETSLRQEYENSKLAHLLPIRIVNKLDDNKQRQEKSKSYEFPAKSLPLVDRLPIESSQLQLISEVQTAPHYTYREGFYPVTPSPALSGPLLGGPPLKTKSIDGSEQNELPPQTESTSDKSRTLKFKRIRGKVLALDKGQYERNGQYVQVVSPQQLSDQYLVHQPSENRKYLWFSKAPKTVRSNGA